jgi:hypothetical protein
MIEKINGLSFPGECEGPNEESRRCEYSISAEATTEGVLITVDCDSWLGTNCVFNEVYENEKFSIKQLLKDLRAQHLKQVEEKIADIIGV